MKKTIRKIGASLLAIGVTAAGVSSIPASAASYYKDKCFMVHTAPAHGYVYYTPNSSYKSVTRCASTHVYNRNVTAGIFSNGINLGIKNGYSYDKDAVAYIYCYPGANVTSYSNGFWAYYNNIMGNGTLVINF